MKTGEIKEVPLAELENFIEQNRDRIQPQYKKMGKPLAIPAITE